MPRRRYAQSRYPSVILSAWPAVFFLTRGLLLFEHPSDAGAAVSSLLARYAAGLVCDLGFPVHATVPTAPRLPRCPRRRWRMPFGVAAASLFASN
jgi:hypothetical protein